MDGKRVSQYAEKMPTESELLAQQAKKDSEYLDSVEYTEDDIKQLDTQKKLKSDKQSKIIGGILIFLNVAVLIFMAVYIAATGGGETYPENPSQYVDTTIKYYSSQAVLAGLNVNVGIPDSEMPAGILDKYKALYSLNTDLVGWLKVPNTSIDCGIYQGADNNEYLRTDIFGNYDARGSSFVDYRAAVKSGREGFLQNTVIFGHHLTSNEMVFKEVENYRDVEFYKTSPVIEFNTLTEDIKWKVIGCFVTTTKEQYDNGYVFYYIQPTMSEQCFSGLLAEIKKRSYFINESVWQTIDSTDKLLMLSTCTYEYYSGGYQADARCVLVCAMMDKSESTQIDVSAAYANPSVKQSQIWYNINNVSNPYINDAKWYVY